MTLSEATINKIKDLIYENKQHEAEAVLIAEAGLSAEEAGDYIARLSGSLTNAPSGNRIPKNSKAIALSLVGISLLMFGLAVYFFLEKNKQIADSYMTSGVVVGFIINEGAAPIISYEIEGTVYQYTSNIYSSPPSYELNETVEIYVNNNDANDIIINSFGNKWLLTMIFGGFGFVFGLIGIVFFKLAPSMTSSGTSFFDTDSDRMTPFDD